MHNHLALALYRGMCAWQVFSASVVGHSLCRLMPLQDVRCNAFTTQVLNIYIFLIYEWVYHIHRRENLVLACIQPRVSLHVSEDWPMVQTAARIASMITFSHALWARLYMIPFADPLDAAGCVAELA